MLILTRKIDESIFISDEIKITVIFIKGNQCILGISAPKHIPVHREERYYELKSMAANGQLTEVLEHVE